MAKRKHQQASACEAQPKLLRFPRKRAKITFREGPVDHTVSCDAIIVRGWNLRPDNTTFGTLELDLPF